MYKLLIIITCLIATSFAGKDCSSCQEKAELKIQKDLTKFYDKISKLEKENKLKEAKKLLQEKIAQLKKVGATKYAKSAQLRLDYIKRKENGMISYFPHRNTEHINASLKIQEYIVEFYGNVNNLKKQGKLEEAKKLLRNDIQMLKNLAKSAELTLENINMLPHRSERIYPDYQKEAPRNDKIKLTD